jgi:hypothetical protein
MSQVEQKFLNDLERNLWSEQVLALAKLTNGGDEQ